MRRHHEVPEYTIIATRTVRVRTIISTGGDMEFAHELALDNNDWEEIGDPEIEIIETEVEMIEDEDYPEDN